MDLSQTGHNSSDMFAAELGTSLPREHTETDTPRDRQIKENNKIISSTKYVYIMTSAGLHKYKK